MTEKTRAEQILEDDHPRLTHEEMVMLEAADPSREKEHWDSLDDKGKAKLVSRMRKHTVINLQTDCHESTYKSGNDKGYRQIAVRIKEGIECKFYVHRMEMPIRGIPLPRYYEVDHICKVTHCHYTDHLDVVTPARHKLSTEGGLAERSASKTRCPQNHPYDEENTYWHNGWRQCRKCRRQRNREASRKRSLERLLRKGEQLEFGF